MVDQEFYHLAEESLQIIAGESKGKYKPPILIVIADKNCDQKSLEYALKRGAMEYEMFLETGDPEFAWTPPKDEWQSIALGYTSGTTASPKEVVLHHRGAYLMSLSNAIVWGMKEGAVYLWTLPMFHCNGWCFTWSLAALFGSNICLRKVFTNIPVLVFLALPKSESWLHTLMLILSWIFVILKTLKKIESKNQKLSSMYGCNFNVLENDSEKCVGR